MHACAELFCVLTNVSNKFVFRRFPLRGGFSPLSPPCVRPWSAWLLCSVSVIPENTVALQKFNQLIRIELLTSCFLENLDA